MIILIPILFGLLGFAVDLGMIYSVKGELKAAANSMAIAAAQRLIGTDAASGQATAAGMQTVETVSGHGNKYFFSGIAIGQSSGALNSVVYDPAYYDTAANAIASATSNSVTPVPGAQARYVRITLTGPIPLLFWRLIPIITDPNIPVLATSVAGISPPLCYACGLEPFAVRDLSGGTDPVDFGFVSGLVYSFAYNCTGSAPLLPAATSSPSIAYMPLNRYNPNDPNFPDQAAQIYRDGAAGLPGYPDSTLACFTVGGPELAWTGATIAACGGAVPSFVRAALCGLDSRFEFIGSSAASAACTTVTPEFSALQTMYQNDSDLSSPGVYTDYAGNGRRIISIPIVDTLSATATMTVQGFRQFLLMPQDTTSGIYVNPADAYGRFAAMYIGSIVPLKSGSFNPASCPYLSSLATPFASGPGKVVLHQ